MPVKKFVPEVIVEEPKSTALDFSVVRNWSDVAAEIQKLRQVMDELIEPYCISNQCHQSYLMSRSRVIK